MRTVIARTLSLAIIVAAAAVAVQAQGRVANFSTGRAGSASFEQFGFWVKEGRRAEIDYVYGADRRESQVTWVGAERWKGSRAFKVKFANGRELYIIPQGERLRVVDASGKYAKVFRWMYEGPVNGRGTFCQPCAEGSAEAAALVRDNFMQ